MEDNHTHLQSDRQMNDMSETETIEEGCYNEVIEPMDWGAAVTKLVVPVLQKDEIKKEQFRVTLRAPHCIPPEEPQIKDSIPRTVTAAYVSDSRGNRTAGGTCITLELPSGPTDSDSNLFLFDIGKGFNTWKSPYEFTIEAPCLIHPAHKRASVFCDILKKYSFSKTADETMPLSYGSYEPIGNGKKPLVIWLHGAGEGGTDASVAVMANRASTFAEEKTQRIFGGTYVLIPQTPKVWMTSGGTPYDINDRAVQTKSSLYTTPVLNLIDTFIQNHPDIDKNRIYIGGASNGGYMTMNLLLTRPGFFAAAFPVCEAYSDEWITDKQIKKLAEEHIWFTAAKTDTIVDPEQYTAATSKRLIAAGAKDIHVSLFEKVVDTSGNYYNPDGTPYEYPGHWSWIFMLNNECRDNGQDILHWLASVRKQTKQETL